MKALRETPTRIGTARARQAPAGGAAARANAAPAWRSRCRGRWRSRRAAMPACSAAAMRAASSTVDLARRCRYRRPARSSSPGRRACASARPDSRVPRPARRRAGSCVRAEMSLTMAAPASSAAAIVAALRVSTDTVAPAAASARITGTTRACSASGETGGAPGRVLSPPTSTMSAPAAAIARPAAMARCGSMCSPPSLKLSGVTFSTPMTRGRSSDRPAQVNRVGSASPRGRGTPHRLTSASRHNRRSPPHASRWSGIRSPSRVGTFHSSRTCRVTWNPARR